MDDALLARVEKQAWFHKYPRGWPFLLFILTSIVQRDRLVIFGGGVPIVVDGAVVGAVGCSGGSAEQDAEVASAGAAAVAG